MKQEHLYELHLQTVDNCCAYAKQMKYEIVKHIELWDKSSTMNYPLFSKKEILKMMQDEVNDFTVAINQQFAKMLSIIEKSENENPDTSERD